MKRKNGVEIGTLTKNTKTSREDDGKRKRTKLSEPEDVESAFAPGLFDASKLAQFTDFHSNSQPYKHCVIPSLIDTNLLTSVRDEIKQNLHFTPKQTDIYSIHQTGDLANLSGLSSKEAALFPNLLRLRNALYSSTFRSYIEKITQCGPLSGIKTDMAINVYTKGCHLLTHDDVIGSRRVSYILYLTEEWKPEWGGALRLYPTNSAPDSDVRIPTADWTVVIPPAFNQLSFFEVQPGFSFHDVEEVTEDGKVRMAISGWFHIPQRGEDGFIKGLEEELAAKSSLQQLQSKSEKYDLPQQVIKPYTSDEIKKGADEDEDDDDDEGLTEDDCTFLLKFINPTYLVPDTLDEMSEIFAEESSVQLANILSASFAAKLKDHIEKLDATPLPDSAAKVPSDMSGWSVTSPPHKARYLYYQPEAATTTTIPGRLDNDSDDPLQALLHQLLPSKPFKKLLQLATGVVVTSRDLLARRFRPGLDYTLATGYDEPKPRVEVVLGLTPSAGGWEEVEDDDNDNDSMNIDQNGDANHAIVDGDDNNNNNNNTRGANASNGKSKGKGKERAVPIAKPGFESWGGYEVYMTGDDDDDKDNKKSDPAVYKGGNNDDDDDGVLFSMPASWNKMSIVYRDTGVLRFVKYVSKAAKGSRWDVGGNWEVADDDDSEEEGDDDDDDDDDEDSEEDDDDVPENGMEVIPEESEEEDIEDGPSR